MVEHLWRIGDLLDELDDPRCAGRVRADLQRRLAEDVAALWLTDPVRRDAPTPLDEVRATLALFDRTIFTTLPKVLRTGGATRLRWATWVGGDRDGNPRVTASVTTEAVSIAREHVLRGYEAAARRIARALSVSEADVPASPALRRSLARDAAAFPRRAGELSRTLPDAPHRRKLVLVAERLAASREGRGGAYSNTASNEAAGQNRATYCCRRRRVGRAWRRAVPPPGRACGGGARPGASARARRRGPGTPSASCDSERRSAGRRGRRPR